MLKTKASHAYNQQRTFGQDKIPSAQLLYFCHFTLATRSTKQEQLNLLTY